VRGVATATGPCGCCWPKLCAPLSPLAAAGDAARVPGDGAVAHARLRARRGGQKPGALRACAWLPLPVAASAACLCRPPPLQPHACMHSCSRPPPHAPPPPHTHWLLRAHTHRSATPSSRCSRTATASRSCGPRTTSAHSTAWMTCRRSSCGPSSARCMVACARACVCVCVPGYVCVCLGVQGVCRCRPVHS
jgi:hypothetical protein